MFELRPKHVSSRRHERGGAAIAAAALLLACSTVYLSRTQLDEIQKSQLAIERPPLYLPEVKYVRLVTLGYDTFFSKLLWFGTIDYFGKQFAAKHDYQWLGQMCGLVTELDSNTRHAYEFCGTLLAWVAKEPEQSTELLTKAIAHEPNYWRYHYLRGFNYWYFLDRPDLAKEDFLSASQAPGAPTFVASLASRLVAKDEGPKLARQFLEEMMANTQDPAAKEALKKKLKAARLSEAMAVIAGGAAQFKEKFGKQPQTVDQLLSSGMLDSLPIDPYKGTFYFDARSGEVRTTSNKKGLAFHGKTASINAVAGESE